MSDVLKWLQNMANEEWEYEDGDYALEAIKFFNSLRAENERLWHVVGLMTTMAPFMEIDVNDPVGMAHSVVAEQTKLFKEKERLLRLVKRIVEHHEHDEDRVSGWTQWEALVNDARAALEESPK